MKKYRSMIILLLLIPMFLIGSTKTDEAHDKMNSAEYTEVESDDSGFENENDEDFLDFMGKILFSLWLNVDLVTDSPGISLQPVCYNPYPYYKGRTAGHRNSVSNKKQLLVLDTAIGTGLTETTISTITKVKYNFYGFSANLGYRFLSEDGADDDIQYYSFMLERKSVALPRTDGGIMLGWNNLAIGSDNYDGFSMGCNYEFYPYRPISVKLEASNMFYKNKNVSELKGELRFHYLNSFLGIGYNYFDIDKTAFRSVLISLGVMF